MKRLVQQLTRATFVLHVPFAGALAWALPGPAGSVLGVGLAAMLAAHVRGPMARTLDDRPLPRWRRRFVEEPYFVHWLAVVFSPLLWLPVGVGLLPLRLGVFEWVPASWLVAYLVFLPFTAWGVIWRRRRAQVRRFEVSLSGLAPSFDGYRIVHLSDLHVGSMTPRELVMAWVDQANRLAPDLVVITGDYVTSGTAFHRDIAAALAPLRARDGVLAIMGNHDYYGDGQPLMDLLEAAGIRLLRNAATRVVRDGHALTIVGLDDVYTQRFDAKMAFAHAGPRPRVVLAHDPGRFAELCDHGADLVLGGHSHWGQVGVPFLAHRINALSLIHPELVGTSAWTEFDGTHHYVHPGLGTTGVPLRFGVAPQVALHVLRAARVGAGAESGQVHGLGTGTRPVESVID
jgi:uncharacterized protein